MMRVDEMAAPAPTRRWFSWGRLKQFIGLYLPASPTDSSWILWMEV